MDFVDIKAASTEIDQGEWIRDIDGLPGVGFKVRSYSSPVAIRALGRAYRAAPDATEDERDAIELDVLARFCLIDWEGLTNKKKPVEYEADLASEWVKASLFGAAVRFAVAKVSGNAKVRLCVNPRAAARSMISRECLTI